MAVGQQSRIIDYLRRSVRSSDHTDGQLLELFLGEQDESAFETLVRRHGAMVLGVCRRILRHSHDAEDAFQATFLVLIHKARSLLTRRNIGNWLHGVAFKTALKAKAMKAKRLQKEQRAAQLSRRHSDDVEVWNDLQPLLDEELRSLPEKYRTVIILCDLEGKSRKEAAKQLRWPEGTVSGTLSRARVMLAKRLSRRGVQISVGLLATILAQRSLSAAAVSTHLIRSTVNAGSSGNGAMIGAVGSNVAALTSGVTKSMLITKLKSLGTILVGIVLSAVIAYTAFGFGQSETKQDKAKIGTLIQQLDSGSFKKRENATKRLKEIGEPALEALQHAAATGSLEVRIRAKQLIDGIERSWQVRVINGHRDAVPGIAVSPDGKFVLAAGRSEGILRLWDIKSAKQLRFFPVTAGVFVDSFIGAKPVPQRNGGWTWDVAFSPDGKQALSADGAMWLWNVQTKKKKHIGKHNSVVIVAFAPNGEMALSGYDRWKSPRLWDLKTGKQIHCFDGHTHAAWNVAFSPDGNKALSCSRDCTIRVWDVKTGKQIQSLSGHTAPVTAAVFLPEGKRIISSSWDKTLRLWDVETGKTIGIYQGHKDKVCDVSISTDGKQALSGSFDNTAILWDVRTGKILRRFRGHTGIVGSVAFVPNSRMAASSSYDKTIRLWKLPD